MKFNGFLFNDHEPYICSIETDDINTIDNLWYLLKITENIELKDGYSKLEKENKEYGFRISVPNLNQEILVKSGTTVYIKADTTSDQCHYNVTRTNGPIKKKDCIFQFKLP